MKKETKKKLEPTQQEKVLRIVNLHKWQKTYEIIRLGMDVYIGDPSRRLRELREKGLVVSERVEKKPYVKWSITEKGKAWLKNYKF